MRKELATVLVALALCCAAGCLAAPESTHAEQYIDEPAATVQPEETVPLTQTDILATTRRLLHDNKTAFTQKELDLIEFLDLNDTGIEDLSELRFYPNLTDLSLRKSRLFSLNELANAPSLTSLDLTESGLTSLDDIPSFKHLSSLTLDGNSIADLSPLERLPMLESLSIRQTVCTVEKISVLQANTQLRTLSITYGHAMLDGVQFAALSGLTTLKIENDGTAAFDCKWLTGLTSLTALDYACGECDDLSTLYLLPSLTELTMRGSIKDATDIAACRLVRKLTLRDADLSRIAALSNMPSLVELTLTGLRLKDVRTLTECKGLQRLTIDTISAADLAYLRENMPQTTIDIQTPTEY